MAMRTDLVSLTVNDTAMAESWLPPEIIRMRIGIIGGGTIARLVLEHVRRGQLAGLQVVALMGRLGAAPRGAVLAGEFEIPYVRDREALLDTKPEVVPEAASHAAGCE